MRQQTAWRQMSDIRDIRDHTPDIRHQIGRRPADVRHQTSQQQPSDTMAADTRRHVSSQTTDSRQQTADSRQHGVRCQTSETSEIIHQTSDIGSDVGLQTSDIRHHSSSHQTPWQLTSDVTSAVRHQTADSRQQTADSMASDVRHQRHQKSYTGHQTSDGTSARRSQTSDITAAAIRHNGS